MAKETIKGKLIYQPQGPAGEYAKWAVNLHNGCTHGCTYCYNRRGVLSHAFGDEPNLAKPILTEAERLRKERIKQHSQKIQLIEPNLRFDAIQRIIDGDVEKIGVDRLREDGGVFFSFKCDPLESNNDFYTTAAIIALLKKQIPVSLLTKSVAWLHDNKNWQDLLEYKESAPLLTIGFTLTGMDAMEVYAPSTAERISALKKVAEFGIKTFVSLEPVIDLNAARTLVATCCDYTKEFRIGLQSPYKKDRYDITELKAFINAVTEMQITHRFEVIWKDSIFNTLDRHGVQYKRYSRPKGCVLSHLE